MSREDPFEAAFEQFHDRLVRLCEPIVLQEVRRIRVRIPALREDLEQVGRLAVFDALPGYDRTRPFAPYVRTCIRHALYREMRLGAPPQYWDHHHRIDVVEHELRQTLRREPTARETAADAGLTEAQVVQVKQWSFVMDADEPEDPARLADSTASASVQRPTDRDSRIAILREAIARLGETEREVLEQVRLAERPVAEVAEELGYTTHYIDQLLHTAYSKVRDTTLSRRNREFLTADDLRTLSTWYSAGHFREDPDVVPASVARAMQKWPPQTLKRFLDARGHCDGDVLCRRYRLQADWQADVDDLDRWFAAEFGWMKPQVAVTAGDGALDVGQGRRDRVMEMRDVLTLEQLTVLQHAYCGDAGHISWCHAGLVSALRTLAHLMRHPNYQNFGKSPVRTVKPLLAKRYLENLTLTDGELEAEKSAMRDILSRWCAVTPTTVESLHGGRT